MGGREKNCYWYFNKETRQEEGPNDVLETQFSSSPYSTLVRESIQNSLDAVFDKSKPVIVKIKMLELEKSQYRNFFELKGHIKGCLEYYGEENASRFKPMLKFFGDGELSTKIGYIMVSDSNTTGMRYSEEDPTCPFYAFALSRGVSIKESNNSGGSFGFGKTAYFQISPIRTILVSSRYNEENTFLGVSYLCTHKFCGEKKTSVGYYGKKINEKGDVKIVPVTVLDEIPVKFRRSEQGTSVSIIGVDITEKTKQKAKKEMIEEALINYWLAICEDKLVINIDEEIIDRNNIIQYMDRIFSDEKRLPKRNPRPYFDAVRFTKNGDTKDCLHKSKKLQDIGDVDLYVKINKDANDRVAFMRRNLMFIFSHRQHTNYGYNALFVCRGERGDRILKELENPEHNSWKPEWRIKKKNLNSDDTLGQKVLDTIKKFIAGEIESIFRSEYKESLNIEGLEEYLYIPENLVSDDEKPFPRETMGTQIGHSTDDVTDDGASPKTSIEAYANVDKESNKQVGHVIVTKPGTIVGNSQVKRIIGVGHKHGQNGPKPSKPTGSNDFTLTDADLNNDGTYKEYIPVIYRIVAQAQDNQMFHNIIFHSPTPTENGEIELVVGGEQTDEVLQILETSSGGIRDNFVVGLHVNAGKNVIRVRFNDNLKHAIILKAYEYKK